MGRLWRSYQERALKGLGISLAQWQVLHYLSHQTEPVVQRRLALAIGVDEPVLVGVLDRLEASRLVTRKAAEHDRRAKTVHLTAAADATLGDAEVELRKMRETLLDGFSAQELDASAVLFDIITERLWSLTAIQKEASA